MNKTLEQVRAADALAKVKILMGQAVNNSEKADQNDKYASYVKSLPATILMNGLGQAAAFLLAKRDDAHHILYKHLQEWLCRDDAMAPYPRSGDLLAAITENSRDQYISAQAEALAWLAWLKKFAVAYLEKPKPKLDGGAK